MKNQEVAALFNEMADLLDIRGDNPFRIRAYRRAAMNIEALPRNIETLKHDELLAVPGIGQDLAAKIEEYLKTGAMKAREELRDEIPEGLLTLLKVPGLGPKTARMLHERLKVSTLEELEKLASDHRLAALPGIKAKTEENIRKGIELLRKGRERQPIGKVLPLALDIAEHLRKAAPLLRLDIAGSLRRWRETVKDIDLLAASESPLEVMRAFTQMPHAREVLLQGPTKSSVVTKEGLQVDLRVVKKESYGAALAYFTGSKAHNIRLREMAVKGGLKLNEYGIFREKDNRRLGGDDEEDIYRVLGMPCIPPELREDQGEIEAALDGRLPRLVTLGDIRGDLHVHSKWSDGSHTLGQLVEAARAQGYAYLALTDHSRGLAVAHGLTAERLAEQGREVRSLNARLRGFRVLHGIEVDIRGDGALDLPDEALAALDIVVASIHSGFRQTKEQITSRMVAAMRNPLVSVIAHPTGRLIGERDAYDVDVEELLRVARETGTALEINAYPLRLDLNDAYARRAKDLGIPVVISTDTHVTAQLRFMQYGVSIGRRGWLEKGDVANTLPADRLLRRLKPGKRGKAAGA